MSFVRIHLSLLLVLMSSMALAQDFYLVYGDVRDLATNARLIGAKLMLYDERDSLVAEEAADQKEYNHRHNATTETSKFNLICTKKQVYTLKAAYDQHDTLTVTVDLTRLGKGEFGYDAGTLHLARSKVVQLGEVTVTASKVMFYNRGDTIVYNADAFQLAEGSMLDELIRQLPGVELRRGGEIYVNGKKVESLLLNGKDFFDDDRRVMFDNLSAYMVKKVEVYKRQSDRDKFLEIDNEKDKQLVMDVKLKKEYLGGWTVNTEAGYGTSDRYMGRLFALHYNTRSQFSAYANVNNMNNASRPSSDDEWEAAYRPNGTSTYKSTGLSYSTENDNGTSKANGSIAVHVSDNLYESVNNTTSFLQTMNTQSHSSSVSQSDRVHLYSNHELQTQTKRLFVSFVPQITYTHGKNNSSNTSDTWRPSLLSAGTGYDALHDSLVNASLNESYGKNDNLNLSGMIRATIKLPHSKDAVEVNVSASHSNSSSSSNSLYFINYGDDGMMPTARRQHTDNSPNHSNNLSANLYYIFRFSNTANLSLRGNLNTMRTSQSSSFYLGQLMSAHTGDYTLDNLMKVEQCFDPTNSHTSAESTTNGVLTADLAWRFLDKVRFSCSLPLKYVRKSLDYSQNGSDCHADYKRVSPSGINGSLTFDHNTDSRYSSVSVSYNHFESEPSLMDMIEVDNTKDPLVRHLANPDLRGSLLDGVSLYGNMIFSQNLSCSTNLSWNGTRNDVVHGSTYDTSTGMRTYKTYNVDGARVADANVAAYYSPSSIFRFHTSLTYRHSLSFNMIGENSLEPAKVGMTTDSYQASLSVTANFSSNVWLDYSCEPMWQTSKSEQGNNTDIRYHAVSNKLRGNCTLPHGWSFTTSLDLDKRGGYDDDRMNTTEWLWNASVKKRLAKGRLLAALTAYDILHQVKTVSYTVTPDSRVESFSNTIPHYILLHLQYKLNIKPGKSGGGGR